MPVGGGRGREARGSRHVTVTARLKAGSPRRKSVGERLHMAARPRVSCGNQMEALRVLMLC